MLASAITLNLASKRVEDKRSNNKNSTPTICSMKNDNLVDFNYGQSLVHVNSLSFKGDMSIVTTTLSKKVSAAFKSLSGEEHILLIGKDKKTAMKQLNDSIDTIKTIITKIDLIEDENMADTVAVLKSKDGIGSVANLGNFSLFIEREGKPQAHFLKKGEACFFCDEDYISTKNPTYGFKLNSQTEEGTESLSDEVVKHFEFSDAAKKSVEAANSKNIEQLIKQEKISSADQIRLADVGGQDEAVKKLREKVLLPIKYPKFFGKNFGETNGTLLVGPPGNGKSLGARAVANEAGVTFFDEDGQLFKEKWYGESGHNIHDFYQRLRDNAPCIAFLDEAEAIYKTRGLPGNNYSDEDLNVHLREITKLQEDNVKVSLVAATNRPDLVDPAILRRFRNQIEFTNLDTPERCEAVFNIHAKGLNIGDFNKDEFMEKLSRAKSSGDDIRNLIEDAKMASLERTNVIESMEKGTFVDDDNTQINIIGEDFEKAFENLLKTRELSKSKETVVLGLGQP